ncbi:TadE/TadG family type IV pilus assembly protein [Agromyces ramosus]|uniref:Flp pilus assembly protein TadG n=1 Tax=Agromyces ramosus TaxID=33879 RepID=A0ABU0R944_9MICO|nr:TadE/TadG family type IV pilus assembly protein [Agromyces ramosus]MDQ0894601.1 Flp pilus assembly protein TadG [Agromyces ramosus]
MRAHDKDRGAAAVEFALMFPLVIMLLLSVIEFSRLWNIQATISDSARIAARTAAILSTDPTFDDAEVQAAAIADATGIPSFVDWTTATVTVELDCDVSGVATSVVTVAPGSFSTWFTSAVGTPITLTANGAMPCGG